jgi:hypothetical protein
LRRLTRRLHRNVKQKRSRPAARPHRRDSSIKPETSVKPQASVKPPPPRSLRWWNAKTVLYVWIAVVTACVVWQPLRLGFYMDDWGEWVDGIEGKPFSLARLAFANGLDPTRPGLLPLRFLLSSLLGDHAWLWQSMVLLVNCCVVLSIVAASRALTPCRTPAGRTITAVVGMGWLLLPWNAAARFWPTFLPQTAMIAVEGVLCTQLIRGWMRNRSCAISAGALYLWMCLGYEAFYFQWIPLVLIGVMLWLAKRTTLRPVVLSSVALLGAQAVAALWNIYTQRAAFLNRKPVVPNWNQVLRDNLGNLVPAILGSVSELRAEFLFCGVLVIAMWLFAYGRSLSSPADRTAGSISALLAGICLLGGIGSIAVFSLGARVVTATGVETRSMSLFNFWIVIAAAIATSFAIEHLHRAPKVIFACAFAGVGLCLAAGQVYRAVDWATAWTLQNKMLAETPVAELKRTEQDARIVILNPLSVNGAPIFAAPWDINHAMPWAYPFLRSRKFIMYNHWEGPMKWNGKKLSYEDQPDLETTEAVYLWRPSDARFWRPAGPFVVNQDLTVIEGR